MKVQVFKNDIEKAVKQLQKKLTRDGMAWDIKSRAEGVSRSGRKRLKQERSRRRRRRMEKRRGND